MFQSDGNVFGYGEIVYVRRRAKEKPYRLSTQYILLG